LVRAIAFSNVAGGGDHASDGDLVGVGGGLVAGGSPCQGEIEGEDV
jgi:hypothetical protein